MALYVVIPAYNAAPSVSAVVRGALAQGLPVLVVDDGSQDDTAAAARAAGAEVLRHERNQGKGAALRTGFAHALARGARGVLTMDADGQHDPAEISLLRAGFAAEPEALSIGVRSFDPAHMPRASRVGNHISTFFISLFAGRRFRDTQSGFRIYPARLLREAPLCARRFEIETELLLWAAKLSVPLREVPISTIYCARRAAPGAAPVPGEGPRRHPTHFRGLEDTLRILRLVISSPFWRPPRTLSQPKMEAT